MKLDGATVVGGYSEDSGQLLSNCSREFAVNSDAAYYTLRAREERTAAMHSSHPNVRRVVVRLNPQKMSRTDQESVAFMFLVERVDDLMRDRSSLALLIADHDRQFASANVRAYRGAPCFAR